MTSLSTDPRAGVNLIGYLSSNVGLGVVARNTLRMLRANSVPVSVVDLSPAGGGKDDCYGELSEGLPTTPDNLINLFHMNPDRVRRLISPFGGSIDFDGKLNVVVPFWEAPRLPRQWLKTLKAMDVILAPTLFVRDAILADLPKANVIHYPQTVFLPEGIKRDRPAFGLAEADVVFVASFALASDVERKNPWAVVDAFQKAFDGRPGIKLVLKINNADAPGHQHNIERLRQVASRNHQILLMETPLSYREVLTLYASADVLVSLHRSEGLGLNMLEAMALGVPVLATGWSGNMDFTTAENSALVKYRLVDIDVPRSSPYHPQSMGIRAQWAEPSIEDAARWMQRLADEPELRRRIGSAGSQTANERQRAYLEGKAIVLLEASESSSEHRRMLRSIELRWPIDMIPDVFRYIMKRLRF